jgi:hypothetical protein
MAMASENDRIEVSSFRNDEEAMLTGTRFLPTAIIQTNFFQLCIGL